MTPSGDAISPSKRPPRRRGWSEIAPYAVLSFGSFLCFLVLLGLMLWKVELLAALGLTGNFYYPLLVLLGLTVSGFLFGALRSYASYSGQHFGGKLELGGGVVVFLLVVILGFRLLPASVNFPLTVYVHGVAGPQDLILKDSGYVLLDLGGDRRREPIGEKGQAFFAEIPSNFRGQPVNVSLDATGYELANPAQKHVLDGASLYLEAQKKPGHIAGRVQDEDGSPLAGVSIRVAGLLAATTDSFGHFDVTIPGDQLQPELPLQALAKNYAQWNTDAIPNANEMVITLRIKH
jgi:hypothetical protein